MADREMGTFSFLLMAGYIKRKQVTVWVFWGFLSGRVEMSCP